MAILEAPTVSLLSSSGLWLHVDDLRDAALHDQEVGIVHVPQLHPHAY